MKSNRIVIWLCISLLLLNLSIPASASGLTFQNPSSAVIAQKLESVARQKNIPSPILKAIAFKESSWRQWDSQGNPVLSVSAHPAIGIMQVSTYSEADTETIEKLKNDIDFNINRGADLLNEKFNQIAPPIGNGDRNKLENWYFAIWAYNSWSMKNNPWQATQDQPTYQDKVVALMATNYVPGYVTPVVMTKIPKEWILQNELPNLLNGPNGQWNTPQPVHLGDLGTPPNPLRLAGKNRIETAIEIARNGWPGGSQTVILARSDDFPDALAGVPLANRYNAPILLTPPHSLDPEVQKALRDLHPTQIIMLGGEPALGPEILTSLIQSGFSENQVTRLAGRDRYETAAVIAKTFPKGTEIALSTGLDFPDALSLAPAAASQNFPILLTEKTELPAATASAIKELQPTQLTVAGAEPAISASVMSAALQVAGLSAENSQRLAGANRYETSAAIVKAYFPQATILNLATGDDFPDALAGAAFTAHHKGALLLVAPRDPLTLTAQSYLKGIGARLTDTYIFGAENVVPASVIDQVQRTLGS